MSRAANGSWPVPRPWYLTLKMQTVSLANKGSMSYAGVLPNGQAFSDSATLIRDGLDTVILPVYYRTAKEFFTLDGFLLWDGDTAPVSEGSGPRKPPAASPREKRPVRPEKSRPPIRNTITESAPSVEDGPESAESAVNA